MKTKNKILTFVRAALLIALLCAVIRSQLGIPDSKASVDEVADGVTSAVSMDSLESDTYRMFRKLYGLNANDYDGVVLYTAVSNIDVRELLIVRLTDRSQADEVTAAVNERLETLKTSYRNYGVNQYALLENSILDVRGNYILYVVHDDAEIADQAFRDSL